MVDTSNLQRHYLSSIAGDLTSDEYAALKFSIQTEGFIDPFISLSNGDIIDGWHRYKAAKELDLIDELNFSEVRDDPRDFIRKKHLNRGMERFKNKSQIAVYVVQLYDWRPLGTNQFGSAKNAEPTASELAELSGVGTTYIEDAKRIVRHGFQDKVTKEGKFLHDVIRDYVIPKESHEREQERLRLEQEQGKQTEIEVPEPAVKTVRTGHTYECRKCGNSSILDGQHPNYCKYCYVEHNNWEYVTEPSNPMVKPKPQPRQESKPMVVVVDETEPEPEQSLPVEKRTIDPNDELADIWRDIRNSFSASIEDQPPKDIKPLTPYEMLSLKRKFLVALHPDKNIGFFDSTNDNVRIAYETFFELFNRFFDLMVVKCERRSKENSQDD